MGALARPWLAGQAMTTIARACALLFVGVLAVGCADASGDNASSTEAAQSANTASIKSGTYDYIYRGREGLIRKLVLRDDKTFEKTEWNRVSGRLRQQKASGTFTLSTKQMPTFVRKLVHFKGANGADLGTFRFKQEEDGGLRIQPDRDEADDTTLTLMETPDGKKAAFADCRATKVHDLTIFEESFTTWEYPDVGVYRAPGSDKTKVDVGSSLFDSVDGDNIQVTINEQGLEAVVDRGDGIIEIVRTNGTEGTVIHRSPQEGEIKVATLSCKRQR